VEDRFLFRVVVRNMVNLRHRSHRLAHTRGDQADVPHTKSPGALEVLDQPDEALID